MTSVGGCNNGFEMLMQGQSEYTDYSIYFMKTLTAS